MPIDPEPNKQQRPKQEQLARYFNVDSSKRDNSEIIRSFLIGAPLIAVLMPALFYLHFGVIDWFAIAFTVFLIVLCLLCTVGFYFQTKTVYHTNVSAKGGLGDRIGAFWLVACAFGPFFGWLVTTFLAENTWRWQYLGRVLLAVVLPVLTAVPLIRYARGRAALIAAPLLLVITALPMLTCWWVVGDLHDGVKVARVSLARDPITAGSICQPSGEQFHLPCDAARAANVMGEARVTWLPHTNRVLSVKKQ